MNGWNAIQMWAKAIAPCEASQIAGFSITSGHLAQLAAQAGAQAPVAERIRSGTPAEVSFHLLSLEGMGVAEELGGLVTERLKLRLAEEALRLDRFCRGDGPISHLIPHRRRIIFDLSGRIFETMKTSSESERIVRAEDRAVVAANEALPYAARLLSVLDGDPGLPAEERRRLILGLREEISQRVSKERAGEVLSAFDSYLGALGLFGNSQNLF